jgi:UDP-glucose 4-epimerase
VTHVNHLAALNEVDSERDPDRAIETNVTGTVRLLRAARQAGVQRFVYLSTAHVYAAPLEGRIDEEIVTRPVHPYAITHRAAEDFVLAVRDPSFQSVALRLSNAVGAPASATVPRWTLLVNDLCRQVATTGTMTLRSSGLARRDFIAMSDACRAIAHVTRLPISQLSARLMNLGGGRSLRVIDVVTMIADRAEKLLGARPKIVRPEPASGEVSPELDYRIDKLLATGFELRGHLEDEIDDTLRLCVAAFGPSGTGATARGAGSDR